MNTEQLTFTRFIAAVSIVLFHYGQDFYPFNEEGFQFIIGQANTGVSYFFILSGFVMLIANQNQTQLDYKQYYLSRFARIYPVYLMGLLLVWPTAHLLNNVPSLLAHFSLMQAFFPAWVLDFNLPAWSVSVEVFFYAVFPLLFNVFYASGKRQTFVYAGIIVFWILSQLIYHLALNKTFSFAFVTNTESFLFYSPMFHLNEFLLGNMAGLLFIRWNGYVKRNFFWLIVGILVLMFVALKYNSHLNFHNGLLGVFFVPLILALAMDDGPIAQVFNQSALRYLGNISYSIYIYQYPVFHYMKGMDTGHIALNFLIKFIVLLMVAALSYQFVETPLRAKIKTILK